MPARLALALIWLLRLLPLAVLAPIGSGLGTLVYRLAGKRRRIARINLALCFPQLGEAERERIVKRHFQVAARSVLERGIAWWSSVERLRRVCRFEGLEHWQAVRERPVILLAPHFVGLDMAGMRVSSEGYLCSMYSRAKNPVFDAAIRKGRSRFGKGALVSRQEGLRPLVRLLRKGIPMYYLPDQDLGARDSVFAPFFGVPTATVTALSRLARLGGAVVVPCVTRILPGGAGYVTTFYPAWENFPGGDDVADATRLNAFIEARVLEMPEQYLWIHRRFKTRPPGDEGFY